MGLNLRIKNTKKQKVISGSEKRGKKKDDGPKKALCKTLKKGVPLGRSVGRQKKKKMSSTL